MVVDPDATPDPDVTPDLTPANPLAANLSVHPNPVPVRPGEIAPSPNEGHIQEIAGLDHAIALAEQLLRACPNRHEVVNDSSWPHIQPILEAECRRLADELNLEWNSDERVKMFYKLKRLLGWK
jgi:hypothetical protein